MSSNSAVGHHPRDGAHARSPIIDPPNTMKKTTSAFLASLLVLAGAAYAAPMKGSINTGSPDDSSHGFETRAPWAKAWGARSGPSDKGLLEAAAHQKNHSDSSLPLNLKDAGVSNWHRVHHDAPGLAPDPAPAAGPVPVASISIPALPVPDGGSSIALLGLSAFGLLKARSVLRKSS